MASVVTRSSLWEYNEIRPLIAIWGEINVQELDGAVRNKRKHIRKYLISSKSKNNNMKTDYRMVKDHNEEIGRGRKTCKFYNEIDVILGHTPASIPVCL